MIQRGGISVLINEQSRAASSRDTGALIQSLFASHGTEVRLERVRHGGDLPARARQAAGRGDALVAAGGDGTVGAVAGIAVHSGARFGVLPMGTLNHFAKDVGIPLRLEDSVTAIVAGIVRDVDVGEINGRVFVNNSSIGIYPRMVWERQAVEQAGRARWSASAIAVLRTWSKFRTFVAAISVDGQPRAVRTPFLFIGNNQYLVEGFQLGARAALDRGCLSVFLAPDRGRFSILTLPIRALTNRLDADANFETFTARELTIEPARRRVSVAVDGELVRMQAPLHVAVRPRALKLLLPPVS